MNTDSRNSQLILSCNYGALGWLGSVPINCGTLGIAQIMRNGGGCVHLAIPLNESGGRCGTPVEIDLGNQLVELIVPTGMGKAVLVTIERQPDANPGVFWPRWFALEYDSGAIQVRLSESWENRISMWPPPSIVSTGQGALLFSHNGSQLFQGLLTAATPVWISVSAEGQIASRQPQKQTFLEGAHQFNFLRTKDGRLLSVFVHQWRSLYFAEVSAEGDFSDPVLLAKQVPLKGQIDRPHLLPSPQGVSVVWRYYNGKKKRETRDSGLYILDLSEDFAPMGLPRRLITDHEVVRWLTAKVKDETVIAWKSGASRTAATVGLIHVRGAGHVYGLKHVKLPMPDLLVPVENGLLSFYHDFVKQPYEWRLGTDVWPLPSPDFS